MWHGVMWAETRSRTCTSAPPPASAICDENSLTALASRPRSVSVAGAEDAGDAAAAMAADGALSSQEGAMPNRCALTLADPSRLSYSHATPQK